MIWSLLLSLSCTSVDDAGTEAPDLTLLYSARSDGEIEPCG